MLKHLKFQSLFPLMTIRFEGALLNLNRWNSLFRRLTEYIKDHHSELEKLIKREDDLSTVVRYVTKLLNSDSHALIADSFNLLKDIN